ncbi:tellurite resistance protein TerC [Azospirillum sp. OGB3]|uniref:TerC family protein n=1 Tax=Azospirillum sp. OGB3 TaxID=2587012 RepID=UPI001606033A|nr:TerC family protein [Azospirillum sp. OGB3]MBB3267202.1 tellurite resistance protein TerC [Azospirillum sp. OGB3]
MDQIVLMWAGFAVFVGVLLAFDLGVFSKKSHVISGREALMRCAAYSTLAMIFAAGVFHFQGSEKGLEFLTGYLIEYSLSVDNIFVIALIFTHFAVPPQYQHRVLFWGILGALVMRGVLIVAGTALIQEFHWIIYIFGAFLIFSGIKMLMSVDDEPDMENNRIVKFVRSRFRMTDGYEGQNFFVMRDGVRMMTPLFLVLILIEFTDLVFAVDSIPAVFSVTTDPFIVWTSNVFAILGLRALYFALASIIHRFHYLKYGLSLVLVVVGAKMMMVDIYKMPTALALGITAFLVGGSIVFSMLKTRGEATPEAADGEARRWWVPGSPAKGAGGSTPSSSSEAAAVSSDGKGQ